MGTFGKPKPGDERWQLTRTSVNPRLVLLITGYNQESPRPSVIN